MSKLGAMLGSLTQPATLGHTTKQFFEKLEGKLGDAPSQQEFETAVNETLGLRRFRSLNPGLRALAEAAWLDTGPDEIKCYLAQQGDIAGDTDARDRWNRDVRQTLGPVLQAVIRPGKKELSTADTVQAFALEHGLPLLQETIKDRYEVPKVEDSKAWAAEVSTALRKDLDQLPAWEAPIDADKLDEFSHGLTSMFDQWRDMPAPEQRKFMDKLRTLADDLKDQPREVVASTLNDAIFTLNRVPSEANLVVVTALSALIATQTGVAIDSPGDAAMAALAVLSGWAVADFAGAVFHWDKDNYPQGRVGREFIDHHYNPKAVSEWPLRRNVEGMVKPAAGALAASLLLPAGALPLLLMTAVNGLVYTQHAHGFSHADDKDIPPMIKHAQNLGVLVSKPHHLRRHHGSKPLGSESYGVLNGWSNAVLDRTKFFRILEGARKQLTGREPTWEHEPEARAAAKQRKAEGMRSMHDC